MKSIFVRILTGFVAVSFAVIAAMSGIFTVAVSRSINEWNAGKRNDFVALILPAISILHCGKIEVQNATNERGDACVCFAVMV